MRSLGFLPHLGSSGGAVVKGGIRQLRHMFGVIMLLTQKEVASQLGISIKTLQRLRQEGQVKFLAWGHRTIRFSSTEIERFLSSKSSETIKNKAA